MNLIKRHKGLALVGGLTLILIAIVFIIFSRMIFTTGDTIYGNRLDGLVKVDKKVIRTVEDEILSNDMVLDVEIRVQGKILYTTIVFKEGTKLDKAKEIASNSLSLYDEDVIKYYDFGYFLKEEVEQKVEDDTNGKTGFIVAGTKHPDIEKISWTKN